MRHLCTLALLLLSPATAPAQAAAQAATPDFGPDGGLADSDLGRYQVVMECSIDGKPAGRMVFGFWPEKAPVTVRNFLRYASEGFYDGLSFHRIIKGFMIQGGDPRGTGSGDGPHGTIPGEFTSNPDYALKEIGRKARYDHVYGVISMARSSDPDSASCQFFICNALAASLDGKYASFGRMLEGKETLDRLSAVETTRRGGEKSKPVPRVTMDKVRVVRNGDPGSVPDFTPGAGLEDADLGRFQVRMRCAVDGQDAGEMVFRFWPEKAPVTVRNFLRYASEGFYDGLSFHRIVKGFMIQGGDPTGTGAGKGPHGTIPGEFSNDARYAHEPGVISMARTSDPDSATCQFFICNAKAGSLDGKYASFGRMVSGEKVLEALSAVPVAANAGGEKSMPLKKVVMTRVSVEPIP